MNHVHKKLVLRFAPDVRQDESGDPVPGWYFDFRGSGIWDPYAGIGYDESVDPRTYYGISLEQANQLCMLNGIYVPDGMVI